MTTLVVGDLQSGKSTSLVQKVELNLIKRPQVVVTTNSEVCLNNLLPRFSKKAYLKDDLPNIYMRQKLGKQIPRFLLPVVMANKFQLQKIKDIFVGTGTEFDLYIDEADCFNLRGATTSVQRNNVIAWIASSVKKSTNTNLVNDTHYTATPHNPFFTSIVYDEVEVIPSGPNYKSVYNFPIEQMEENIYGQVKYEASKSGKRVIIVCTEKLQKEHHKQAQKISISCPESLVVVVNSAKGNKIWCKGVQRKGNFSDMEKYFQYAKDNGFESVILVGGDMFTRAVTFKDRDAEFEFGAMFYKIGNSKNLVSVIQTIGRIAGYQSFYPTIYCEKVNVIEQGILVHQQTSELVKSTNNELFQQDLSIRQKYLFDNVELKDWMFDPYERINGWKNSRGRDVDALIDTEDEDYSLGVSFDFKIPKELIEVCLRKSPAGSKDFKNFIGDSLQKECDGIPTFNVDTDGWCKVPAASNKSLVTWWQDPSIDDKHEKDHRCFIYSLITSEGKLFKRAGDKIDDYDTKDLPYRVRGSFQYIRPNSETPPMEEGERYDLYNPAKDVWETRHFTTEKNNKGKVRDIK